jgi:hypothetical protein
MAEYITALKKEISLKEEQIKSATEGHSEAMNKLKESVTEGYIQMQTKVHSTFGHKTRLRFDKDNFLCRLPRTLS